MPFFDSVPGETPLDDISGLKIPGILLRRELNHHEAENILLAIVRYLIEPLTFGKSSFDYSFARQLHREMFENVWTWAGQLRQYEANIGMPPMHLDASLYDLFASVPYWESLSLLEQAARLHHRAVYIHPFPNGNGRWSRLLANVWLRLNGHPSTDWPETVIGNASAIRAEYLVAIRAADEGDFNALIELHRRYTEE